MQYRVWLDSDKSGGWSAANDISRDTYRAEWKLGLDSAVTLGSVTQPGTMAITVRNYDDKFNLLNSASPYHGRVQAYTLVGVDARADGDTGPWTRMVTMYVDKVVPSAMGRGRRTATISAFGPFAGLAAQHSRIALGIEGQVQYVGELAGQILRQVYPNAGGQNDNDFFYVERGDTRIAYSYLVSKGFGGGTTQPVTALAGLRYLENLEIGRLTEDRLGRVNFRGRKYRWRKRQLTADAYIADETIPIPFGPLNLRQGFGARAITTRDPYKDVFNVISADTSSLHVTLPEDDLWVYDPVSGGNPLPIAVEPGIRYRFPVIVRRVVGDEEQSGSEGVAIEVLQWDPPVVATEANWRDGPGIIISRQLPPLAVINSEKRDTVWRLIPGTTGQIVGEISEDDDVRLVRTSILPLATPGEDVRVTLDENVSPPRLIVENIGVDTLYIYRLQLGGVEAAIYASLLYTQTDQRSIDLYKWREWKYPAEFIYYSETDAEEVAARREAAVNFLNSVLLRYRYPRQNLIVNFAVSNRLNEYHALHRTVHDVVDVTFADEGLQNGQYWLEYEKHIVEASGHHTVEWGLTYIQDATPGAKVGDNLATGPYIKVDY